MIIAISGKIGSGKDETGLIIQYLTTTKNKSINYEDWKNQLQWINPSDWQIKKFADKLKDIVCLLIDCTREQLENQYFKNKELREEWWYFYYQVGGKKLYPYLEYKDNKDYNTFLTKLTPRLLLQIIGTECSRNIIHPSIWVNALMNKYKKNTLSRYRLRDSNKEYYDEIPVYNYPNWVITDMRFPNEMKAIKDKGGISIRITRPREVLLEECVISEDSELLHESETVLDDAKFDYIIDNNSDIEQLIKKVKSILINEKII